MVLRKHRQLQRARVGVLRQCVDERRVQSPIVARDDAQNGHHNARRVRVFSGNRAQQEAREDGGVVLRQDPHVHRARHELVEEEKAERKVRSGEAQSAAHDFVYLQDGVVAKDRFVRALVRNRGEVRHARRQLREHR